MRKEKALEAGLDLQMPGYPGDHTAKMARLVSDGQLSETVIDEAATRVLRMMVHGKEKIADQGSFSTSKHIMPWRAKPLLNRLCY